MAKEHANDRPQGFSNRIEKVAIIGVCQGFGHPVCKLKTAISNSAQ